MKTLLAFETQNPPLLSARLTFSIEANESASQSRLAGFYLIGPYEGLFKL